MYTTLLFLHSLFRWLVLITLLIAIYRAYNGWGRQRAFTATDNALRHWTATLGHIQLLIGFTLYFTSPIIQFFYANTKIAIQHRETAFFGWVHILLMFSAVMVLTFGSALSKRKTSDREKFRTMLIWFIIALLLIFVAVPWPFSPLANRPYLRTF